MKDRKEKTQPCPVGFLTAETETRTGPVDPGAEPLRMLLFSRLSVVGLLRERPMTLGELEARVEGLMRGAGFSRPDDLVGFLKHILWLMEKEGRVVSEGEPPRFRFR